MRSALLLLVLAGCSPVTPTLSSRSDELLYGGDPITLRSPMPVPNEAFGASVAMSGDTAVVGTQVDRVHVFRRSATKWDFEATLTGSTDEFFGTAVAISGDTAVVGAHNANVAGKVQAGAAYVYVRTGSTWTQQAKLVAADGAGGDFFGRAVAIDGNTILAQATPGGGFTSAPVYVFARSGTTWSEQQKLPPSYGSGFAISGTTLALATGSSLELYTRASTTWSLQQSLPLEATAVALRGDLALVGIRYDSTKGTFAGAARFCSRIGTTWSMGPTLYGSASKDYEYLGSTVALGDDRAIVSAPNATGTATINSGVVYVFTREPSGWIENTRLFPTTSAPNEYFGRQLGFSGDHVLGGVPAAFGGGMVNAGAVYTFRLAPTVASAAPCKVDAECTSGHCVDGVCCDRACDGPCESCKGSLKVSGADGVCGPTRADTDPRDKCTPTSGVCAADGMCDGAGSCRSFAKPGTACGASVCAEGKTTARVCKGDTADCVDAVTTCDAYACGPTACKTNCLTDVDCAPGYRCGAASCLPTTNRCSEDRTRSIAGSGAETACGAFRCDVTSGLCFAACASEADCAPGNRCSASGQCGPLPAPAGASGCAYGRAPVGSWALAVLLLGLGLRRRR